MTFLRLRVLHKMWNSFFEKSSANANFLMICHSQGSIHVRNALLDYPPDLRERILVVAIAPSAYIYKETCANVFHYRAEWWRDLIPRFDIAGAKREKDTIITLTSHPDASGFDHEFMSPTLSSKAATAHYKLYSKSGEKFLRTIIAILFLLIFTGFIMSSKQPNYQLSKGEQLVNSVLSKTAKIIKSKYDLKPSGEGAAMPGGPIQELALCFDTKNPHTKEQLRELLIKTAQELLNHINENKEIQEFIKEPPFTIKNIQIIIYNHDTNGRSLRDPEISNAQILQGILSYSTIDPEDSFKYKNEYEESYEEALKALSILENKNVIQNMN